jgi:hypothetical protein
VTGLKGLADKNVEVIILVEADEGERPPPQAPSRQAQARDGQRGDHFYRGLRGPARRGDPPPLVR